MDLAVLYDSDANQTVIGEQLRVGVAHFFMKIDFIPFFRSLQGEEGVPFR
jgi:hypothetical protein